MAFPYDAYARTDPWRIVIKGMGASRGPGTTLATLTDPKSTGCSILHNAGGELHFTLPVDHAEILTPLPKLTHAVLEIYENGSYVEVFAGLIDDMHATDTDVIFYAVDYLGLFQRVIDERWDPDQIDLPVADGGSKYVDQTISDVVTEQLTYQINVTNSPVGFIAVGDIATMDEHVTIWSTFQPCLQFVVGLIDSHRQGTGIRTRISVQNLSGTYTVVVEDNPGSDLPALDLEYVDGSDDEMVQGYQIIPFGNGWGTVMDAIGRTQTGLKVLYQSEDSPDIDQATWGRFTQTQVFLDLADENDLARRAKQAASRIGKQGRQIGLGLRTKRMLPLDGYDICDSVPVSVVHGAVDTTAWGNGYWTIWGLTWEGFDDSHAVTNLILLPQDGTSAVDPAIQGSSPIGDGDGTRPPPAYLCDPGLGDPLSFSWVAPVDANTFDGSYYSDAFAYGGGGSSSTLTILDGYDFPLGQVLLLAEEIESWQIEGQIMFTGGYASSPVVGAGYPVNFKDQLIIGGQGSPSDTGFFGIEIFAPGFSSGPKREEIHWHNDFSLLGVLYFKIRRIETSQGVFASQVKYWPLDFPFGFIEPAWTELPGSPDFGPIQELLFTHEKSGGGFTSDPAVNIAFSNLVVKSCAGATPLTGQQIYLEAVAVSDGSTDTYTTSFPYAPGTLDVQVDGLPWTDGGYIETDPTTGAWEFLQIPITGDTIQVSYTAA